MVAMQIAFIIKFDLEQCTEKTGDEDFCLEMFFSQGSTAVYFDRFIHFLSLSIPILSSRTLLSTMIKLGYKLSL